MIEPILVNLSVVFAQRTGIATYAVNLVPHLQSLDPVLLTANNYPDFSCYPIPGNLTPAQGAKGHFRRLLWTQFLLPQIYKRLKASLLFSPIPEAPLNGDCRYVVMCHDLIPLRFPKTFSPLTYYFRYCVPQILATAEHIICNSMATARDISEFYAIPPSKITPICLAYDRQHFRPRPTKSSPNLPYFLYIGRHDSYKNLHRLLAAFAAMDNSQDYQLWLVGSTDRRYTPQLQRQARELGIEERVKFLNYVCYDRLPEIISNAIALVFPTLWEGFGLPVLEAMACGTPVITAKVASLTEIAEDAAILINPYHTREIAAAMATIANDSALRSQLSQLGLQRASQFSWSKTGRETKAILQQYV